MFSTTEVVYEMFYKKEKERKPSLSSENDGATNHWGSGDKGCQTLAICQSKDHFRRRQERERQH